MCRAAASSPPAWPAGSRRVELRLATVGVRRRSLLLSRYVVDVHFRFRGHRLLPARALFAGAVDRLGHRRRAARSAVAIVLFLALLRAPPARPLTLGARLALQPPSERLTDKRPTGGSIRADASRRSIREGDSACRQERKVGSVTYQEVGRSTSRSGDFETTCGRLVAVGPRRRRRHLRRLLRLELRSGHRRVRRTADRERASSRSCTTASATRIAEMSPALPHTGGAYSFARSAMGPWGGFLTGLAENMEYVITPAVVVGAIGLLMQEIMTEPVRRHREPVVEQPAVLVGGLLHHLRGDQHHRASRPRCASRW